MLHQRNIMSIYMCFPAKDTKWNMSMEIFKVLVLSGWCIEDSCFIWYQQKG